VQSYRERRYGVRSVYFRTGVKDVLASFAPEGGTRRNMPVFCESALLNTTIRSDCIEERQVMRDIVAVIRSCRIERAVCLVTWSLLQVLYRTRVRICAETYGLAITFGSARC
jgi:hypothetical protein